jgi:hypothetical protein
MNNQAHSIKMVEAYLNQFQKAQKNYIDLIKEERLQKRIRKSKQHSERTDD